MRPETRLLDYPDVTKVAVGTRVRLPDPKVYHTLSVETEIALSNKQNGYDQNRVEKLLHAAAETMEEIAADEADIYTTQDRDMIISAARAPSAP